MREELSEPQVRGSEASHIERLRERLPRPPGLPATDSLRDPSRPEARPAAEPEERPEVVRVEVSQRQAEGNAARPVVVVQVELPPTDQPRPREPDPRRPGLPVDDRPRLSLESRGHGGEVDTAHRPELGGLSVEGGAEVGAAALLPAPRPPWPQRRLARLPVTVGMVCPRCGEVTYREPTPWFVRPLRWLLLGTGSWRRCPSYHWSGLALHR